jgi:ABC-type transport system involved in cytochrome bd biosynthesis fused ATPase/permease subunit
MILITFKHKNMQVELRGRIAYVPQLSWIQNGTVEENMFFGLLMDQAKYHDILQLCVLQTDLAHLKVWGSDLNRGTRYLSKWWPKVPCLISSSYVPIL